jgi:glutamyl-tRNA synthetase
LKDQLVPVVISGGPTEPYVGDIAKHKKNAELGTKQVSFSSNILLEQIDAASLEQDEEITLMDWGNAIVKSIIREDGGSVVRVEMQLHLEGDFKKTSKKLTWLSPDPQTLIPVILCDYDYLITKKKLEEDDPFENFITPVSEFTTPAVGDANLVNLKKGDIIQLERKGFYICDQAYNTPTGSPLKLIFIPDGRVKTTSSKAAATNTASSAAPSNS